MIAVDAGAFQVQGTVNGYGERTGNADLMPITADLVLKMGVEDALPDGSVGRLTELAHFVAEIANLPAEARQPYAGRYAFTHKAGLHTSGVARVSRAYEHVPPETVGNRRGVVASDYGGGATIRMKAEEFGLDLPEEAIPAAVEQIKEREASGYAFDVAEASLDLLLRRGSRVVPAVLRHRELPRPRRGARRRRRGPPRRGDGEGPHEGDAAHRERRRARGRSARSTTPCGRRSRTTTRSSAHMSLEDYRVRVLDESVGTGAVVRVLIDTSNGERDWTTVGVSENIIEASWAALVEAYTFGLLHPREHPED